MDSNTWNFPNIPRPLWQSNTQTVGAQQINPPQNGTVRSAVSNAQPAGTQQKNPAQVSPAQSGPVQSNPTWSSALPTSQQANPTAVSPAQSNPSWNSMLLTSQQTNPTAVSPVQSAPQWNSVLAAEMPQKTPAQTSPAQSVPQWNSALPTYQQPNPTMVSPAQTNTQQARTMSAFPAETPIGMAYVPFQKFGMLYDSDTALENGTIFAELFKPWLGSRAFMPNASNTPVIANINDLYSNYFRMSGGEGSVQK